MKAKASVPATASQWAADGHVCNTAWRLQASCLLTGRKGRWAQDHRQQGTRQPHREPGPHWPRTEWLGTRFHKGAERQLLRSLQPLRWEARRVWGWER